MKSVKPKESERGIQRAIRQYLAQRGYMAHHVPNGAFLAGGAKDKARQMALLKGDGLCVGFPDLVVMGSRGRVGFMEVKNKTGSLSQGQTQVRDWMKRDQHKYAVVRSIDDAKETLIEWGWG